MVTKDMARSEWTRIRSKEQVILPCTCEGLHGKISLLKMLDVSEPFRRVYDGEEIVLADNGYYWLQLAMEGEHAWFTVMFDDQGNLLQIYVDVTNGNHTDVDDPTFEDLFLDYVVYGENIHELDRDELDAAYASGSITKEQFDIAQNSGKAILQFLTKHLTEAKAYFIKRFDELKAELDRTKSLERGKTAKERAVDSEITLIPYYPNSDVTLAWYQDPDVCRQVDNIDHTYSLDLLNGMYSYLSTHGECYYICYCGGLVGDVSLQDNGEVSIVVCKEFQNRHIGRRCIAAMLDLAKEKGLREVRAHIYSFNTQSQRMFEAAGFRKTADEWYSFHLDAEG